MRKELLQMFETTGDLTSEVVVIRLTAAAILAAFIFISYHFAHEGSIYSRKFNISLVALTMITTTVMIVIGNNLAMSLGMVGALSIVRFRTAIKDSRDTVYIFWTIVVGICCGAGDYVVAGIGSAFIFLMFLFFGRVKNDNRILLIIRGSRANEEKLEALIFQYYARKATLRVKNTTEDRVEYIFEINKKTLEAANKPSRTITDAVYSLGNIEYFNIVSQNEEIGS